VSGWLANSILALLCWGLWAFLPKLAVRHIPVRSTFLWEVVGGLLVAAFVLMTLRERVGMDWRGILPAVLTGVAGYMGMLFFLFALQTGKVSVIAPLTAVYPVITVLLGLALLGERLSGLQLAGAALALLGVFLLSRY
jgi:transporter family protein